MIVKLLTEHHLELLSLKGGCSGPSESTLVKMPPCWKSHATAQLRYFFTEIDKISCTLNKIFSIINKISYLTYYIFHLSG